MWRTDDRLMLRGCTLLSVLLRLQSLLEITSSLWTDYGVSLTNFMLACKEANFKVTGSCYLKETSKPVQNDSLFHESRDEQTGRLSRS